MKENEKYSDDYISLDELLSVMKQELSDAREEYDRISNLPMPYFADDDSYILDDYLDDLQEYVDEME